MFYIKQGVVLLLFLLGLSGCAGDNEEVREMSEEHKLRVIAGEHVIACTPLNQELDSMDAFKAFFADESLVNYRGFKIDATWESGGKTYIFAIKEK